MGLKLPGAGKCTATTPNELEKVYPPSYCPWSPKYYTFHYGSERGLNLSKSADKYLILANDAARGTIKTFLKKWILKKVFTNQSSLFVRGQDKISILPLIGEPYEPEISSFMKYAVSNGFSNFLFDVGANIGLTSCQEGHQFDAIYCYEPNPLLYKVLETNLELVGLSERTQIKTFGIGATEGEFLISMPINNLGAGFVQNQDNSYTPTILARKDNNPTTDFSDYLQQKITIKSAELAFRDNFRDLSAQGLNKGIIKIDVEGMELSVIGELIKSIPKEVQTMVVFENHDLSARFTKIIEEVAKKGTHSAHVARIQLLTPYKVTDNRIIKGLKAFFGNYSVVLNDVSDEFIPTGSVVISFIPRI